MGVAIGIAALSLIVALAGGLQEALVAPALATSQLHQVAVFPVADAATQTFDSSTLATLSRIPHVSAAWGQVGMSGTFTKPANTSTPAPAAPASASAPAPPTGLVISLPPLKSSSALPVVFAGRLPTSDASSEILLTDNEATALGFRSATSAIGTRISFSAISGTIVPGAKGNAVTKAAPMDLIVVGIVSSHYTPAGAPGGMVPYSLLTSNWEKLAKQNGWKSGEFSSITLLADSGLAVEGLRHNLEALGFQTQTFGDQFRNFEDLLGKLRVALLGLALVALLLACLGIANTMYTAVLERTKEIGVLKALGSRSRDVLLLFVAEAAVIGLAGGLIGALFAVALARLGNAAVDRLTQQLSTTGFDVFRTSAPIMLAAIVLAVVLSTVSGLLPAVRAAAHDPARALRYE
jgi:ABC-type antimicrobial peptide transport system permease subunit